MILLKLFAVFFKIGLFTFGGGYAMIPMITDEVMKYGWSTAETLTDFIAISESTPGTFAINTATFIGYEQANVLGGVMATLGVIMPSFLIILLIAKFFGRFSDNKYVKAFLAGVRPVVAGLIAAATFSIAKTQLIASSFDSFGSFFKAIDWKAVIIFVIVFALSRIITPKNIQRLRKALNKEEGSPKSPHPIYFIILAGALGALFYGVI